MPSHALVTDRAEQMLARSRRSQVATAALVVGLDNMSDINTLYGWDTGDEVLRAVGQRLSGTLREADTVGRLGGDEFVVLAEGASLAAGPEVIAERLLDVLRGPIHLEGGNPSEVVMSASVGIALGPRLAGADLLRDAGIAMRQAKSQGAGRFALFELDTSQALESRIALEGELRRAVDNEEFTLRYQPIFDIDSCTTTGVEAFLRWERPDGRLLPPDHFISHLERAGLMDTVGRWVLRHACIQGAELRERGRPISMSVNVSLAQLESESLVSDVADALSTSGLDPHALVIEVAEMALLRNTALALQRLTALKALGVRIAVDDFGTGFSSLAYLRQFPIDILKIDRSFIDSVATSSESSTLIHTLVEFGQTLGLEVIAEGIENEGQLHPLILANCDAGQGFLYGRPLTPAQLDLFLSMHDTADSSLWVVRPE
jgi:diguanylate cyclase (GGDEF)-like protein